MKNISLLAALTLLVMFILQMIRPVDYEPRCDKIGEVIVIGCH